MSWDFQQVAGPFGFTEGPAWNGQALFFSDIPNDSIIRFAPDNGHTAIFSEGSDGPNGLAFDTNGDLYVCEMQGRRITRYEPDGQSNTVVSHYEGRRLNSPNDLYFDQQGRLWFTDPIYDVPWANRGTPDSELGHRSVYRIDQPSSEACEAIRVTHDTCNPNGLAISRNQETLYVAELEFNGGLKQLEAYPITNGTVVDEKKILHNFAPHRGTDGMCLDDEGCIIATGGWRESGPGPMMYIFTKKGHVLETHPVPFDKPTNCTFGDEDLKSLYVTSADGYLYRAKTNRRGIDILAR